MNPHKKHTKKYIHAQEHEDTTLAQAKEIGIAK